MASNSPVLPILVGGGLLVGGILAFKAISNRDDTSGFISGVTGSYIDEPSQRVILTDLRQDGRTDRVIERYIGAANVATAAGEAAEGIIETTGESIWNPYLNYKKSNNEDRRDTRENSKKIKVEGRNERAENRQETRLANKEDRRDSKAERQETRQETRLANKEDRRDSKAERQDNRQQAVSRFASSITNRRKLFNRS